MYKPGQLITKSILGRNYVFRLAKRKSWDSACLKCVIIRVCGCGPSLSKSPICKWCRDILGPDLYLKKA